MTSESFSTNATPRRAPAFQVSGERIPIRRRSQSLRESTSPTVSHRRSVSSMKGLMPLRLSTSCSSLGSGTPSEEKLEVEVDGYIPELLVRDLENSNDLFASRNMSAGLPIPLPQSPPFVESQSIPRSALSRRVPSPVHPIHIPSLRPIEEISSMTSGKRDYMDNDTASQTSSSFDSFTAMDAPSIPFQRRSLTAFTAATSLSSSGNLPSPKEPNSPGPVSARERVCSWMEDESDTEDIDYTAHEEPQMGFLSPRPSTPPVYGSSLPRSGFGMSRPQHDHRRSQSVTVTPKLTPRNRQAGQLASAFHSNVRRESEGDYDLSASTFGGPARSLLHPSPRPRTSPQLSQTGNDEDMSEQFAMSQDDEDFITSHHQTHQETYMKRSAPPSPPPTVQQCLTSSVAFTPSPIFLEDSTKAVPLPSDTLETLRVSVTCFPETMLLTSSLTTETIRRYAKKVRHPHLDFHRMTPPPSPPQSRPTSGRSLWRKVSSYRRRDTTSAPSPSFDDEAPKPWMGLRVILGGASEYVCDALYAHILAFNYVSALLPHYNAPAPTNKRHSGMSQTTTGRGDAEIPKKALSLLGIKVPGSPTKNHTTQQQQNQDILLRDVHAGLVRCITGLIATARMITEEGCSDDGTVLASGAEVDGFLFRSLCEVVRLSEEGQ